MKIGIYQNRPEFGQVERNVEQALKCLSAVDANLVVLPELFNTGYQFLSREEAMDLAEVVPNGRTCSSMIEFANRKNMFLVFGIAEKAEGRVFNSAALVGPMGLEGIYRKTHLFADEKNIFQPGDTGFKVFDIGLAKIGMMICFDWWFPESARALSLMGADIICHPANLVLPQCQKAMLVRSLENGVFTCTANRTGEEFRGGKERLVFTGESQIVDNAGNAVLKLGKEEIRALVCKIDPTLARDKSITSQNDRFKDRRPDFYSRLTASG